jgi:hypothetical protein
MCKESHVRLLEGNSARLDLIDTFLICVLCFLILQVAQEQVGHVRGLSDG